MNEVFVALVMALMPLSSQGADCRPIPREEVPIEVLLSLENEVGGGMERLCRTPTGTYRAHGRGSGITVEMSPGGDVLGRQWDGR
jgi:hypothetical protein